MASLRRLGIMINCRLGGVAKSKMMSHAKPMGTPYRLLSLRVSSFIEIIADHWSGRDPGQHVTDIRSHRM